MALPTVVSEAEWRATRDDLLVKEKAATRALDALAAERRRLPIVRIENDYEFEGPDGKLRLVDLFEGRRQLIVYHFMFGPGEERVYGVLVVHRQRRRSDPSTRPRHGVRPDLPRAVRRDPRVQGADGVDGAVVLLVRQRLQLRLRITTGDGERSRSACSFATGDSVYRSYVTSSRGVDRLRLDFNLLDLTPLGRQEEWEDSPDGWPQTEAYTWWRKHDEYEEAVR